MLNPRIISPISTRYPSICCPEQIIPNQRVSSQLPNQSVSSPSFISQPPDSREHDTSWRRIRAVQANLTDIEAIRERHQAEGIGAARRAVNGYGNGNNDQGQPYVAQASATEAEHSTLPYPSPEPPFSQPIVDQQLRPDEDEHQSSSCSQVTYLDSTVTNNTFTVGTGLEELRYLQLFRLRFIHTVSGWFGAQFWTRIVLPATSLEPAILHAVIALSVAHRCEFPEAHAPDVRERFMLQQYSKAMHLLQSTIHHRDRESITIVLIACQIFTFLEYLRGKPKVAEAHLQNGLRLLKNTHKGIAGEPDGVIVLKPSSQKTFVDRGIAQRFATLHIQASLFGRHLTNTNFSIRPLETEIPFPTFESVEEAKDLLDDLLQRVLLLSQQFQKLQGEAETCPSTLLHAKDQVKQLLAAWLQTYLRTTSSFGIWGCSAENEAQGPLGLGSRRLANGVNAQERLAYILLLNYHTMATIMCTTLSPPYSQSELQYESHTADSLAILEGSIEIWKIYSLARRIPGNVELANSIGEIGPTPLLYYTALKCRVRRIRGHAVRLLGMVKYKEGVWDTALVASVAEKVVTLEEDGQPAVEEEFSLQEVPRIGGEEKWVLPEESLFMM
ncbi:hypothetical protein K505DRAFT_418754 [Melanomma pulvis-pyrius CBS 109.77]|uniref:Zn(II)2Cys6 transcription factor-like protein n=1 Tax=Melanomma pulvis-pyrius CBS 109.77 TaxID=1314802 RepID=A0A6A6X6T1_9PLEO|nr:hypothetical protein K505DRAFT_418754 [Melanomma pulvis-pyrius CBS 109.77]